MIISILALLCMIYILNKKINILEKKLDELNKNDPIIPTEISKGSLFQRLYGKI